MIEYFTDGSCSKNGYADSFGGFGVVGMENGKVVFAYSHHEKETTNNRQELKAILYTLIKFGKDNPTPVVYTDSAYCYNTLTSWMWIWERNGWLKSDNKTPENLDLIREYFNLYSKEGYRIQLQKCKGHNGVLGNELADKLATGRITAKEIMDGDEEK